MKRLHPSLLLASLLSQAAHAAPDEIRAVRLACTADGVDPAELRRTLSVELVRAQTSTTTIAVELDARPCLAAELSLELVGTSSTHRGTISLVDVPLPARARASAREVDRSRC